jgi:hypothetical protein
MKKNLLTFLVAVLCFTANAQQLANAGFESWTGAKPNNWNTLVLNVPPLLNNVSIGQNSIQKSTSHQGGEFSLQVSASQFNPTLAAFASLAGIPDSLLNSPVPGLATNGTIDIMGLLTNIGSILTTTGEGTEISPDALAGLANYITGGLTITSTIKPSSVSGFAKANILNLGDLAALSVIVLSNDGGTRHVIGAGAASFSASSASFTAFDAPIIYFEPTATAHELIVLCSAISSTTAYSSVLFDDLLVNYTPTATTSVHNNKVEIFCSNSKTINIKPDKTNEQYSVGIFDIAGKKIYNVQDVSGNTIINIPNLSKGIYFCKFSQNNECITRKIVIR